MYRLYVYKKGIHEVHTEKQKNKYNYIKHVIHTIDKRFASSFSKLKYFGYTVHSDFSISLVKKSCPRNTNAKAYEELM